MINCTTSKLPFPKQRQQRAGADLDHSASPAVCETATRLHCQLQWKRGHDGCNRAGPSALSWPLSSGESTQAEGESWPSSTHVPEQASRPRGYSVRGPLSASGLRRLLDLHGHARRHRACMPRLGCAARARQLPSSLITTIRYGLTGTTGCAPSESARKMSV